MTKLFVVGFPREMEEQALYKLFGEFGDVTQVTIITDQQTGESKGYAFIDFEDEVGAKLAIKEMDGHAMDSRIVHVKYATRSSAIPELTGNSSRQAASEEATQTLRAKRPRLRR